jgi:MraZ protein
MDVDMDAGSRVLLSPELRAWAGLDRELMLVGMGSRMEIWDRERYAANESLTLSQPMPDGLRNMVM